VKVQQTTQTKDAICIAVELEPKYASLSSQPNSLPQQRWWQRALTANEPSTARRAPSDLHRTSGELHRANSAHERCITRATSVNGSTSVREGVREFHSRPLTGSREIRSSSAFARGGGTPRGGSRARPR
jgi:hypothetical protein